ncbi:MAG: hypothetical protein R2726_20400 [Acidimicrobiales bacterium]
MPLCDDVDDLEHYVADLFATFEANRALAEAAVVSPWTQRSLTRTRTGHLAAMVTLLRRGYPDAADDDVTAAAAALRTVVSGAGWGRQRQSCGLSAEGAVANAR